jgi:hypothetical protein
MCSTIWSWVRKKDQSIHIHEIRTNLARMLLPQHKSGDDLWGRKYSVARWCHVALKSEESTGHRNKVWVANGIATVTACRTCHRLRGGMSSSAAGGGSAPPSSSSFIGGGCFAWLPAASGTNLTVDGGARRASASAPSTAFLACCGALPALPMAAGSSAAQLAKLFAISRIRSRTGPVPLLTLLSFSYSLLQYLFYYSVSLVMLCSFIIITVTSFFHLFCPRNSPVTSSSSSSW